MMHGLLPDSALVGTYKRTQRRKRNYAAATANPTGIGFLFTVALFLYLLVK